MTAFTFEFATVSPEVVAQLKAMEPAKRVILATKMAMEVNAPLNDVQAQELQIGEVDDSLRFFLESLDLETCKEICTNPEVRVFNSRLNAILDSGVDVAISYKDKTTGVF